MLTGKAQLAAAKLDNLGSNDRGDKVTLSASVQALVDLAGHLISEAQSNLNKAGAEATGELESSIKATDIDITGSVAGINIELLDRYKFIDEGVNGVEQSQGSKFSFKTKTVPKGMKDSIKKWLRIRGRRAVKYKPISKTERKDQGIAKTRKAADSQEGLAYAVATSVKKKGIKKTKFFTNALKSTEKRAKKEFGDAFKADIINSLKNGNSTK